MKPRKYVSDKIKVEIIKKQNFKCNSCGNQFFGYVADLHHKDGDPMNVKIENLEALCGDCHFKKHGWKIQKVDFVGTIDDLVKYFQQHPEENVGRTRGAIKKVEN